jgi:cytochrome c biogenesis protein CcdA
MNTYQIRVLTVFGLSFVLACVVGGGLLAGALMTEQYTLFALFAAGLIAILAGLSYALASQLHRWEREARVRRYMRSTLATVTPGALRHSIGQDEGHLREKQKATTSFS